MIVESMPAQSDRSREEHRQQQLRRAVIASAIGTSIEWYDFFLYGVAAALIFPQKFFPNSEPFIGTLLAFSTYFVGFVARPVGAVIFGHLGDRVGRKTSLIATLLLMGISTAGIGLVPSYETIGSWGAVLLTLGRVMQGIGVGGEWGGFSGLVLAIPAAGCLKVYAKDALAAYRQSAWYRAP
mgnify:CR=1 FL=1